MDFTAVVRKGERQYVALCPEIDVVSQGETIEAAINNLKEAVEAYVEEMGAPTEIKEELTVITHFELPARAKAAPRPKASPA
jgi:predicted RNase H-like HicB family nuclease